VSPSLDGTLRVDRGRLHGHEVAPEQAPAAVDHLAHGRPGREDALEVLERARRVADVDQLRDPRLRGANLVHRRGRLAERPLHQQPGRRGEEGDRGEHARNVRRLLEFRPLQGAAVGRHPDDEHPATLGGGDAGLERLGQRGPRHFQKLPIEIHSHAVVLCATFADSATCAGMIAANRGNYRNRTDADPHASPPSRPDRETVRSRPNDAA
jgi:hypothetical protein